MTAIYPNDHRTPVSCLLCHRPMWPEDATEAVTLAQSYGQVVSFGHFCPQCSNQNEAEVDAIWDRLDAAAKKWVSHIRCSGCRREVLEQNTIALVGWHGNNPLRKFVGQYCVECCDFAYSVIEAMDDSSDVEAVAAKIKRKIAAKNRRKPKRRKHAR